jgi:hypothetical protein
MTRSDYVLPFRKRLPTLGYVDSLVAPTIEQAFGLMEASLPLTFLPPANLKDFDRSQSHSADLYKAWHTQMSRLAGDATGNYPASFSDIDRPPGSGTPKAASPEWTGLPRTIKRIAGPSIAAAAKYVDAPRPIGAWDPVDMTKYDPFRDAHGKPISGPAYRSQDEYLEWAVKRDQDGVITRVLFTAEGPEYWDQIAADEDLLLNLYRELCENDTIAKSDLVFDQDVTWKNPYNRGGPERFKKGSYNRYNKWNMEWAVHLTQPANTLGAEVTLALEATLPYGTPSVTMDPDLACCAGYGGINRMSDPTIGSGVNTQVVQLGRRVALRNPIGLYIKRLQPNVFTLADGTPFDAQDQCWTVLRPDPNSVTDMIVRAQFQVPPGVTYKGKQLRVGDLYINNEQVVTGGQIADVVTMTLYALAIPGAPQQTPVPCRSRPCRDKTHPDFIHAIPYSSTCPPTGISPQTSSLLAAAHFSADAAVQPVEQPPRKGASMYTRTLSF